MHLWSRVHALSGRLSREVYIEYQAIPKKHAVISYVMLVVCRKFLKLNQRRFFQRTSRPFATSTNLISYIQFSSKVKQWSECSFRKVQPDPCFSVPLFRREVMRQAPNRSLHFDSGGAGRFRKLLCTQSSQNIRILGSWIQRLRAAWGRKDLFQVGEIARVGAQGLRGIVADLRDGLTVAARQLDDHVG